MATSQQTIDYLLDQLSGAGDFRAKKMFGEYCFYLSDKPVALVCDDQLFLKQTTAARSLLENPTEGIPYPKAKPHFLIDADLWEDREWLAELILATAAELPPPKIKKTRSAKVS